MTNPASQQPAPIPANEQRIHDYFNGVIQAIIQGMDIRVAGLEAALRKYKGVRDGHGEYSADLALSTPLGAPGREKEGS